MVAVESLAAYSPVRVTTSARFLDLSNWIMEWLRERLQSGAVYTTGNTYSVRLTRATRHFNTVQVEGVIFRRLGSELRALTAVESAIVVNLRPLGPDSTQVWVANTQWPHALFSFVDELIAGVKARWCGTPEDAAPEREGGSAVSPQPGGRAARPVILEVQPLDYRQAREQVEAIASDRVAAGPGAAQLGGLQAAYIDLCRKTAAERGPKRGRLTMKEFSEAQGYTLAAFRRLLKQLDADWSRDFRSLPVSSDNAPER
jgi:hypothetical protein